MKVRTTPLVATVVSSRSGPRHGANDHFSIPLLGKHTPAQRPARRPNGSLQAHVTCRRMLVRCNGARTDAGAIDYSRGRA